VIETANQGRQGLSALNTRQKAERIVQLFRGREPTEALPLELSPADLDEPFCGAIFASEVHYGRAVLCAADYCRIGVETEIAFSSGRICRKAAIETAPPRRSKAAWRLSN
jgi:hypothetical protein